MARMTKEDRAELEARLAADDDDDDDDQVTISHGDQSFTGSFRRAREVAGAWGMKLKADPPPDKPDKPEKDTAARFAGRRIG